MSDDLRWLSRYQLLYDLWHGRDRIIVDPVLERLVCGPDWETFRRRHPAGASLIDALLPDASGSTSVRLMVVDAARARTAAARRGGTMFTALDDAPELALRSRWEVALIELDRSAAVRRGAVAERTRLRADPLVQGILSVLSRRSQGRQTTVLSLSMDAEGDDRVSYDDFSELVAAFIPDAAVYGLSASSVTAAFRFVEDEGEGEGVGEGEDEDEGEVPIEFDNTLGSEDADVFAFVAVSPDAVLGDHLTLIELPSSHSQAGDGSDGDGLGRTEERSSAAVVGSGDETPLEPEANAVRLDHALADQQALRWQVARLEGELARALSRPVTRDEAKLAELRDNAGVVPAAGDGPEEARPGGARRAMRRAAVTRIGTVVRRLERGDTSAVALRRQLTQIRALLGRARR
ncbi:MAG: hypothetical protein V3V08_21930 [Nannocystaceae bacterium]